MLPEFTYNPGRGESYREALELKGNPAHDRDWWERTIKPAGVKIPYTLAHYAVTEARFRQHLRKITSEEAATLAPIAHVLALVTQDDVVHRRVFDPGHRSFVPDFGVCMQAEDNDGHLHWYAVSRQLVLLCVERRKAWRLLQSKAGIDNLDYRAQRALLGRIDTGELTRDDVLRDGPRA
jgi:pyruvate-ferredoxin/flavodoxin oxidoreductase